MIICWRVWILVFTSVCEMSKSDEAEMKSSLRVPEWRAEEEDKGGDEGDAALPPKNDPECADRRGDGGFATGVGGNVFCSNPVP
jgi:hypothetical protein